MFNGLRSGLNGEKDVWHFFYDYETKFLPGLPVAFHNSMNRENFDHTVDSLAGPSTDISTLGATE